MRFKALFFQKQEYTTSMVKTEHAQKKRQNIALYCNAVYLLFIRCFLLKKIKKSIV
jgi:hypothetical protein